MPDEWSELSNPKRWNESNEWKKKIRAFSFHEINLPTIYRAVTMAFFCLSSFEFSFRSLSRLLIRHWHRFGLSVRRHLFAFLFSDRFITSEMRIVRVSKDATKPPRDLYRTRTRKRRATRAEKFYPVATKKTSRKCNDMGSLFSLWWNAVAAIHDQIQILPWGARTNTKFDVFRQILLADFVD